MGKKRGKAGGGGGKRRESDGGVGASTSSSSGLLHTSLSLREQATGKKQSHNPKSMLKLNHLHNLAEWASGQQQHSLPSLGAFFGRRFADFGESLGINPHPSLFPCQRCETILQPGFNCTIRIEKNRAKRRRRGKTNPSSQNNVVYTCHFCSHRNLKLGTPKGHVKQIGPPKAKLSFKHVNSAAQECASAEKSNASNFKADKAVATPLPAKNNVSSLLSDSTGSPLATTGAKLLDSKRRKRRKPGPKSSGNESLVNSAPAEIGKAGGTTKRRKKSWTTLKEIAESEEHEKNQRFTNFSIPFLL